jgi:hypothetical protein
MRTLSFLALLAAGALQLSAQFGFGGDTRTATITGGGGDRGKCTIEVEVDGAADVEVSGTTGRIRNLSGQRATWRRLECSDPLPRNMSDFRFRGIDGRGNVQLVRDPRQNRGIAVVRIEDPKGGREGYTFDLEWSGNYNGGDYNRGNNGYYNDDRYDRRNNRRLERNNGWNRNRGGRDAYTVTCEADGNRRQYCGADTTGGVRMLRGNGACREGDTWGYDRRGIWVTRGCRAEFEVGR